MVSATSTSRITSQISANPYSPARKNSSGHAKLTASCTPYSPSVRFFAACGASDFQIRKLAQPISRYRIVHTTGNTQPGGDSGGCAKAANCAMLSIVSQAASPPTASGISRQMIKAFRKHTPPFWFRIWRLRGFYVWLPKARRSSLRSSWFSTQFSK